LRSDTSRLLWLHEFYVFHEGTTCKPAQCIYQALRFALGVYVPEGEVDNMTEDMRRSIWVQGLCYLPADDVRKFSERKKGYLFHTNSSDADARIALYGSCPELVRVQNSMKWHQMKFVSAEVPRVVHADDVHNRRVHVAGRANHYVCGVVVVENLLQHHYSFALLPRSGFCMYPEERLGMGLNSASMMWEHLDDIFQKLRACMSAGRQGTTSATFTMPLLCTVYDFWQVAITFLLPYNYITICLTYCVFLTLADDRNARQKPSQCGCHQRKTVRCHFCLSANTC
jgi:hypothetical protein